MSRKTRKLIWSAPLVAVLAVVGALAIFAASTPGGVFAHDAPGAVTGLTATADGKTAVDLKWTPPTDGGAITGYRIDLSNDGQAWETHVADTGSTANTYRDMMGIRAGGSDRYYRVFAMNSSGIGPVSNTAGPVIASAAGSPSDVRGLVVRATGQKTIELTWNAPADDGGTPIKNYLIYYAPTQTVLDALAAPPTSNDAVEANADGGGVAKTDDATRRYVHEVSTVGATVWFRVYAYNGASFSQNAAETRSSGTLPLTDPSAPTDLIAVQDVDATNTNNVRLYWSWPTNTGGRDVDGFKIERKGSTGGWVLIDANTAGTYPTDANLAAATASADYVDEGITADGSYQYRVSAITGFADEDTAKVSVPSNIATVSVVEAAVPADCDRSQDGDTPLTTTEQRLCNWDVAQVLDGELSAVRDGKGNVEIKITRNNPAVATSFRIDVSPDGNKWSVVQRSTGNIGDKSEPLVYEYLDATTGSELRYRVIASVGSVRVPANDEPQTVAQKPVTNPGQVTNLRASAVSPTQIDITWGAPATDGGANVDMYCVVASEGDGTFETMAADAAQADDVSPFDTAKGLCAVQSGTATEKYFLTDMMSYSHGKLTAEETWYYRVFAINNPVYGGDNRSATSDTVSEDTDPVAKPGMPEGLTAEVAKDSNYGGRFNQGVLLLWNAPEQPAGGEIDGYRIERMVNGGDWVALVTDTGGTVGTDTRTVYHDTSEPAEGEMRGYRVAARSGSVTGEWSMTAYIPTMAHVPSKPTAVMATQDADMPASKIKVSWSAPAMNADSVDGYIIERRYTGDMVMDIPSDGYSGENGANRSFAFSNYKEWWETLNCKGMLAVAGSSETEVAEPAAGSDQAMYCAHFLNTAPSNITDSSKELTDAAQDKIKVLFKNRYVVKSDDMGMTMTMFTGMMYTDMGLEENTEYIYRVRAIHGKTAGPWSDKAMATTDSTDKTLGAPTDVKTCVAGDPGCTEIGANEVLITWGAADNADRYIAVLFDSNFEFDADHVATHQTDGSVKLSNVPAGTYTAVVISIKDDANGNAEEINFGFATAIVAAAN